jgi:hypothetical protein
MVRAFAVAVLILGAAAQTQSPDAAYYPLRSGAVWTYRIEGLQRGKTAARVVTWKVTHVDRGQTAPVFQVWPSPMQADDEAMRLQATPSGIQELDTHVLLLEFPLKEGAVWTTRERAESRTRTLRVLSIDQPCRSGETTFSRCLKVQDSSGNQRTVVTYAYEVGPVKYEYFEAKRGVDVPIQTLEWIAPPGQ